MAHRVQRDDVPVTQVVGVVAFGWVARCRAKVAEVARSTRRVVFVVARRGLCPRLMAAPGGIVAVSELGCCAGLVGVVSGGEDRARNAVEQLGGSLVARA